MALFLLFLYGPFIVLGILSFQQGPEGGPQFPIIEWSVFWYKHILGLAPPSRVAPLPIGVALFRSLTLAFMTMITSTVLGVMAAQAFRRNFRGKTVGLLPDRARHDRARRVGRPWLGARRDDHRDRAALVDHRLRRRTSSTRCRSPFS